MIHTLQKQNIQIKKEADEILYTRGVIDILKLYGLPHISGSYELDLMTWRDLDIYLEVDNISETDFFILGGKIASALNPLKMSFRNELIGKTKGLPNGLYWGIYLGDERNGAWKIDIWAINKTECKRLLHYCEEIKNKLNHSNSLEILNIKSQCWQDPEYRKSYISMDIYEAVLENNINTIEGFIEYKNHLRD